MRRSFRLTAIYALEGLAVVLALAIFVAAAALWRLAAGPVEAGFLRPAAEQALADAFGGERAQVERLSLRYDPGGAALVIEAEGVRIDDAAGQPISTATRIEAGLALDLLLLGRAAPVSIASEGGLFSIVRAAEGGWSAGPGFPERVAMQTGNGEGFDLALASDDGALSRLRAIDLRGVSLRIVDERDGLSLILNEASALARLEPGHIGVDLTAELVTTRGPVPLRVALQTDRALDSLYIDASVAGLAPSAVAPRRGPFSALSRVDAPLDGEVVVDASRRTGLRTLYVDLDLGAGQIADRAAPFAIESGRANLTYDAQAGEIEINALSLDSGRASFDLAGRIFDIGEFESALPGRAQFDLAAGPGRIVLEDVFPDPVEWSRIETEGVVSPLHGRVRFDRLDADLPQAVARLTGLAALEETETGLYPALSLSGGLENEAGKQDVLSLWPLGLARGARDWVESRILGGRLFNIRLDLDIPAAAFEARALEDEALSLRFDFADAGVRYISTMTELTGLSGSAELRGNSLSLTGADGLIDDLNIETVFVDIPRLNPRGAVARFGGTGRGGLGGLIALLDQPPLEIAGDYGLDAETFSGTGSVSFEISRPMLSDVPYEDIGFEVTGSFTEVAGPAGFGDLRFDNGVLRFETSPEGFTAEGSVDAAGGRMDLVWRETFGLDDDAVTTRLELAGLTQARELDQLGLPARQFLNGPVGVQAELSGRGFDFSRYAARLDLTGASVSLPGDLWSKRPGAPASVDVRVARAADGGAEISRLTADGEGARIRARASLGEDGRLIRARVTELFVDGAVDLEGVADRPEGRDGPLRLRMRGPFLDATGLIDQLMGGDVDADEGGAPLSLVVDVDDVRLRNTRFNNVLLSAETGEDGLERFQLSGFSTGSATGIRYGAADDGTGRRALSVETDDAGLLLEAMSGFTNVSGGAASLSALAPPPGEPGGMEGSLSVTGFRLDRMPLLTRVLAAGSLEGLASLLGGGRGIDFDTLQSDFIWTDGTLEMRDSRAAGPALGLTWSGVVDLSDERLAVDGTLLPSYGANSLLGNLPIVGELLVSRRGEGVIGITYSVEGPFESARVVANPLSALAPGVFRRIFEGSSAIRELDALEAERAAQMEAARERARQGGEGGDVAVESEEEGR